MSWRASPNDWARLLARRRALTSAGGLTRRMGAMSEQALAGRRVLDLADGTGAYCGKLLADMGADVVKIEPPGGDATRSLPPFWKDVPHPDRSLFFLYMNTSKRGVTLDLATAGGQACFRALARTADVIIETFPPGYLDQLGLGYPTLRADNPRLVLTSITGFGQTGPYRHFKSSDIVASALGGALYVTGDADDPPVTLAGSQAHMMASVCAAASSLIALYHAATSGHGQHIDIATEEVTASVAHICGVGKWLDDNIIPKRMGTALFASVPSGAYRCKDGLVYLMINRPLHWQTLAAWINEVTGNEVVLDPMFEGPSSTRQPNRDLIDLYISELTARFTVDEVYREGQRRHLAFTPVNTAAAVTRDAHLAARNYFVDLGHSDTGTLRYPGAPYRHSETPWRMARPAPLVGEHNDEIYGHPLDTAPEKTGPTRGDRRDAGNMNSQPFTPRSRHPLAAYRRASVRKEPLLPLHGLRVVEFSAGMAGPWIGRFMAYYGAEVIKVESKQRPDVTRQYVPPWAPEMGIQSQLSPWLTDWNAGKRFVTLDLTKAAAIDLAKRIVAASDVVVENYATGVIAKLGLAYAELRHVKPDVIMLSSSGYGDSGPCARYVTWGPNIEALSGLSTLSGFPERECTVTQYAYPDAVSALHGLVAVMCALDYRRRTGAGQYINLSQFEATVGVVGHVMMEQLANDREPQRRGNRALHAAPHGCYRCSGEDSWCAIAVFDDAEWRRFCEAAGKPACIADPRFATTSARLEHVDELDRLVEEWTCQHNAYAVMATLQDAGIAAGVVQNVEDQCRRDRQLAARGFFEEIDHAKKGKVVATGIPLGLTGTPGRTTGAGAAMGQDNDYVFGALLGMTPDEIKQAAEAGVIEAAE